MKVRIIDYTLDEISATVALVGCDLKPQETVILEGGLGLGKTTFVAALVRYMGISQMVSSPSYVLQHEYRGPHLCIEHWDLYRVSSLPEELEHDAAPGVIRLIEWGEKFSDLVLLSQHHLHFSLIEHRDATHRRISWRHRDATSLGLEKEGSV